MLGRRQSINKIEVYITYNLIDNTQLTIRMYYIHTPDYKSFTLVEVATAASGPTFTDAAQFRGILNGDLISVHDDREPPFQLIRRYQHPQLAGILILNTKTIYGLTGRNVPIYLFHPFDRRYPPFRVGCTNNSRINKVATVAFEDWSSRDTFPRGALIQLLGDADSFAAQRAGLEVVASPFYSHKAFMGLPSYMEPPSGRELLSAADGWTVFNVDPEGCRDIDDCIAVRGDEVAICIADVDAAVPAGGRVDEYASLTAQTIYHEGTAIRPMLPPALSEGICSLVADQVRPAVALRGRIVDGTIRDLSFQAVNIINGRSYSYEGAGEALKEPLRPLMKAIGCTSDDSHEWIAATMTLYNLEAAKILVAAGQGILRAHSGPKAERFAALSVLGADVAARLASDAAEYCDVRSDKRHAGFGLAVYCHATSPIRRYSDLVNQRILKGTLLQIPGAELIYTLNVRAKAAKEYERACAFMEALAAPTRLVDVVSVDGGRAYVPAWGRLVKYAGPSGRVRYFYDASKPKWNQKLVFEACAA